MPDAAQDDVWFTLNQWDPIARVHSGIPLSVGDLQQPVRQRFRCSVSSAHSVSHNLLMAVQWAWSHHHAVMSMCGQPVTSYRAHRSAYLVKWKFGWAHHAAIAGASTYV
jgi:hypothetical protein